MRSNMPPGVSDRHIPGYDNGIYEIDPMSDEGMQMPVDECRCTNCNTFVGPYTWGDNCASWDPCWANDEGILWCEECYITIMEQGD